MRLLKIICAALLLLAPPVILAGITITIEPSPEKFVILRNPYKPETRYAFIYVRAYVNTQRVDNLNQQIQAFFSQGEIIEVYLNGELVLTFDAKVSERLMSIVKKGWNFPVTPLCPNVMLYIRYGLFDFSGAVSLIDTGRTQLEQAIEHGAIAPGDVVVIRSEVGSAIYSSGLIYLGKGYFLTCENGADSFYFRHFSHIDSEHKIFNQPQKIYKVVLWQAFPSTDSGPGSPGNETGLTETYIRLRMEIEPIDPFSLPSYIK